jgi:hypothetical protein
VVVPVPISSIHTHKLDLSIDKAWKNLESSGITVVHSFQQKTPPSIVFYLDPNTKTLSAVTKVVTKIFAEPSKEEPVTESVAEPVVKKARGRPKKSS